MARLKATALRPGDSIGIIAPASPARSEERISKSVQYFERLGYRVELGKHLSTIASLPAPSYLAASDTDRVADVHAMFCNKRVKAIFYHRGGYGSIRLLDKIDYDLVARNPKIVVGYSDATALFAALHKKTALSSCFFGPMPGVDLWDAIDPFTEENFWRALTSTKPLGKLPEMGHALAWPTTRRSSEWSASGRIVGGNLTVFCSLLGTPYQPSFRNVIPLFEEIDEKPRRIDACLTQLRLAGLFEQANAVILGYFTNCIDDTNGPTQSVSEVLEDFLRGLRVPVISKLPFGHESRMLTLPFGAKVKIAGVKGVSTISLLDSALE